jgi:hypothetical protein
VWIFGSASISAGVGSLTTFIILCCRLSLTGAVPAACSLLSVSLILYIDGSSGWYSDTGPTRLTTYSLAAASSAIS